MKYCTHCGAQVNDEAVICTSCGCRVSADSAAQKTDGNDVLGIIAKILMVLSCVAAGISGLTCLAFIPLFTLVGAGAGDPTFSGIMTLIFVISGIASFAALIWCIPMTVHVFKKLKNNEPISTGMKVCILIFVNVISGILLLCMKDKQY